jgi:3-oxoacyl-[acyl-carrier-protein] synthase II
MAPVVVSGIGVLCAGIAGRAVLADGAWDVPPGGGAPRVPEHAADERLPGGRTFRRVAAATKFALAAMAEAVRDAGFTAGDFGGERTALIVSITHGAVPYSAEFHRVLMLEGPASASPLYFSESVPNAPAGNAAVAFGVRGPVHTLIQEEPVGTQAIALGAQLLREGRADRCLVVGTEEWSAVVAHAYAQVEAATRRRRGGEPIPPLTEGAAALVLELAAGAAARGVKPAAQIAGWRLGVAGHERSIAHAVRDVVRGAFVDTRYSAADADHILLPLGSHRAAAGRGVAAACDGGAARVDLAPCVGNPAGATNVLQVAASAAVIAAGRFRGPGVAVSAGITGTVSATVVAAPPGSGD